MDVFPQSSAAIQVLEMDMFCGHDPGVITSLKVNDGTASQLSEAVAVPVFAGKVLAVH